MDTAALHSLLTWAMLLSSPLTFIALSFGLTAPYGRYSRSGWGLQIPARIAWVTMEAPSLTALLCMFRYHLFSLPWSNVRVLLGVAFVTHYLYRIFLFPLSIRGGKSTPVSIWAMSFLFCLWNGFLQGWSLTHPDKGYAPVLGPRVLVGLAMWAVGFASVVHTDQTLVRLRKPGESGYKIPRGGMFEFVSAGNYASEILEWSGFALAAGTLPAIAFAVFAFCNLAPRGVEHHRWYRNKFEDYPKQRKAIIPFLW